MSAPRSSGPLRLAIVGSGFAEQHLGWISACPDLSATILCYGADRDKAEELARRFGVADVSDDALAAVASGSVDAAVIVTPPALHEAIASAALENGAAVLCDKPLAASLAAASRIAGAASRSDAGAFVFFQWRLHPLFAELRRRLAEGALGTVLHSALAFQHDFLAGHETHWRWRHLWEEAGAGALGDMGVHLFDLLRFLSGAEWSVEAARGVRAFAQRRLGDTELNCETEDMAEVLLSSRASAARATVAVSRVAAGVHRISGFVTGTSGSAEFVIDPDQASGTLTLCRAGAAAETLRFEGSDFNPYSGFARACAGPAADGGGFATFEDGLRAQELLDRSRREMAARGDL